MNNSDLNQWLREQIIQKRVIDFVQLPNGKNMTYTYNREKLQSNEPDEGLIDKLSPNQQTRYIYRWNNGRVGAIFPSSEGFLLDFREYQLYEGPDNSLGFPRNLRPVKEGDEENDECKELLASGIIAYYLYMRNKKDPKDIFADYLEEEKKQYFFLRDAEMRAWDPKYKKDFPYSEHIRQEERKIRHSSQLFDFLSPSDVAEIKDMAENYLEYARLQVFNNTPKDSWAYEKMCFRYAVLRVMKYKKKVGGYLFEKSTHWMAVYRFAVDIGIMYYRDDPHEPKDPATTQYKTFEQFAHELLLDVPQKVRIPFKRDYIENMSKDNYARYCTRHPWSMEGLKEASKSAQLFREMNIIYKVLEQSFYNLTR